MKNNASFTVNHRRADYNLQTAGRCCIAKCYDIMSNNNIILLSRPVVGLLLLSTILIAVILLIDIANLAYAENQQQPQNVTQLIQKLSTPVTSNASALGSSDAPVTLIEFGDYQCAADQGKYCQYHDKLYNSWQGENTGWITKANLT